MADQKQQDQPRHGRDVTGPNDPARTRPFQMNEPRPKSEIVEQAYSHEDPTPSQQELDEGKLDATFVPPGAGDPQSAEAQKRKKEQEQRSLEAQRSQPGQAQYQTRSATPKPE